MDLIDGAVVGMSNGWTDWDEIFYIYSNGSLDDFKTQLDPVGGARTPNKRDRKTRGVAFGASRLITRIAAGGQLPYRRISARRRRRPPRACARHDRQL
ncbi:hypothetical protein EVAR_11940_1 [Eumeta japonica]|uniref:Uncharacterized protein n=1 Tax=Eumeta variegata TaxID=151549 RepID=A0A4C1U4S3_EUMVA|nr:hypothetical protein EVAR_11940_1 [Eumeta japonica]